VLPTGSACDLREPPRGAVAMLVHAMSLLIMRRLLVVVELLRDRAELIVMPPPCPLTITPIDFSHSDELIRRGYEDGRDYLDAVEAGQAAMPLRMVMHDHRPPGVDSGSDSRTTRDNSPTSRPPSAARCGALTALGKKP
jgi:NTE family protein